MLQCDFSFLKSISRLIGVMTLVLAIAVPVMAQQELPGIGQKGRAPRLQDRPFPGDPLEAPPEVPGGIGLNLYIPGRVVVNGCFETRNPAVRTQKLCICADFLSLQYFFDINCNGQFDPPPGGLEVLGLGGSGGGGQSMQSTALFGRIIADAIDANRIDIGSPDDFFRIGFDSAADETLLEGFCGGAPCDDTKISIPATGVAGFYKPNGQLAMEFDPSGRALHDWKRPIPFPAVSWEVDGSVCETVKKVTSSLPNGQSDSKPSVSCITANTAGKIDMSESLDGSTKLGTLIDFTLKTWSSAATPISGSIDFNVSAKCENPFGGTRLEFGDKVPLSISYSTTGAWESATVVLVPNVASPCTANSILSIQMEMLAGPGQSEASLTDVHLWQAFVLFVGEALTGE